MTETTAEGLKRYPRTAGYNRDVEPAAPCTCKASCVARCAGECGCAACSIQFADFCAEAGFHDAEPGSQGEKDALSAYRAGFEHEPPAIIHRGRFDGR